MKFKPTKKCEWCERNPVLALNASEEEWVRVCGLCLEQIKKGSIVEYLEELQKKQNEK